MVSCCLIHLVLIFVPLAIGGISWTLENNLIDRFRNPAWKQGGPSPCVMNIRAEEPHVYQELSRKVIKYMREKLLELKDNSNTHHFSISDQC